MTVVPIVPLVPFLLCQLGAFFVCCLYLSFFEWFFHRYAFHTPKFNRAMFRAHTLVHHQLYKGDESYRTHHEHPEHVPMNWYALPLMLAAHLPLFGLVQWKTGLPVVWGGVLGVCVYFAVYESIHWAMHVPRAARWLGRFRVYRFLDAHHRTHHKYMLSNLNVVLPLADLTLGTLRRADGSRVPLFRPAGPVASRICLPQSNLQNNPRRDVGGRLVSDRPRTIPGSTGTWVFSEGRKEEGY